MSRERLEEIKTRLKFGLVCLKHLRREILNSDDESLKYQVNLLENDIRYLFKQAERVQELKEENKRYREAIERAMKQNIDENYNYDVDKILSKALEDE